jgi:hypothetical protein
MKVSSAINFCLQYHKIRSRANTIRSYTFLLSKFGIVNNDREMESIATEEIISFLVGLSEGRKQNTKRCQRQPKNAMISAL